MAGSRAKYEDFADMPAGLRDFLLSDAFDAAIDVLQKRYTLSKDQVELISGKLIDASFNDLSLAQAFNDIKKALVPSAVSEDKWALFLADLIQSEVWPLRELYGDELTQILTEQKIPTNGWPPGRVILKPLTYSGAASEVGSMVGISLLGPQIRERLRDLVMSRAKGVRTDAQVREVLVRQGDFGGLGLDQAMADKAIAAINQIITSTKILSEDEYGEWLAEETRKKTERVPDAPLSDDDAEIARIKADMPAPVVSPATVHDKAVEEIFSTLSVKLTDEYLTKRLRYIISSRLRDVRSGLELRQLLARDTKVGGVGLPREQVDSVATQIEEGYKKFHSSIMEDEKKKLDVQLEEQKVKIDERRKREAEEHAAWYREKVQARQQEEEGRAKFAEQVKQSFAQIGLTTPLTPPHPMDVKEQKTETARFGEMVPAVSGGATPMAAPVAATAPAAAPAAASVPAPAPAFNFAPATPPATQAARPEVKVSKATVDLQNAAPPGKPRMDDVKYGGPRLSGPVQELKGMTLTEFRRLGKDPEVAAQKIQRRIETLAQESFERKMEGIAAWQSCPLQQSYMTLVSDSFRLGKPVVQLAEDKRKAGENVPSPAEITAIISLNSKLHF